VRVVDTLSGHLVATIAIELDRSSADEITDVALSPDGRALAVASWDNKKRVTHVEIWKIEP
jgi:hypothetical protein